MLGELQKLLHRGHINKEEFFKKIAETGGGQKQAASNHRKSMSLGNDELIKFEKPKRKRNPLDTPSVESEDEHKSSQNNNNQYDDKTKADSTLITLQRPDDNHLKLKEGFTE